MMRGVKLMRTNCYLQEVIDYGGAQRTRGSVITDMQKQGVKQSWIDRYMQGTTMRLDLQSPHSDCRLAVAIKENQP